MATDTPAAVLRDMYRLVNNRILGTGANANEDFNLHAALRDVCDRAGPFVSDPMVENELGAYVPPEGLSLDEIADELKRRAEHLLTDGDKIGHALLSNSAQNVYIQARFADLPPDGREP